MATPAAAVPPTGSGGGLVLYGNSLPGTTDTWLLTGATWTQLQSTYDAGRFSQPVLVDDGLGLVLVGLTNQQLMSGRRLLGSTWAPLSGLVAPPYRQRAAVGFDRRNGELVAFGGTQEDIEVMQVFDGRWHQVQPTLAPGAGIIGSAPAVATWRRRSRSPRAAARPLPKARSHSGHRRPLL